METNNEKNLSHNYENYEVPSDTRDQIIEDSQTDAASENQKEASLDKNDSDRDYGLVSGREDRGAAEEPFEVNAAHNFSSNNVIKQPVNVQNVRFPHFSNADSSTSSPLSNGNIDIIMNVPLNVSVEIGKTKKKIKEIMEFSQGTIIELEKQAGAPIDIVVNGQLIARGDVVVIEDSFGVRITEIIGTKDILATVDSNR